jgi:predicted alpha/beta hydrolase family esterase
MSERNCIIIHGCPSAPTDMTFDKHWIPWVQQSLNTRGITTTVPLMPTPWKPNYEEYKKEFEKQNINERTILIGHSCGAAFLVRWLGDSKKKVDELILVAPWKIGTSNEEKKAFYNYPIDPTIKDRVNKIVMFTADNEHEDGKRSLTMFHDALGGKIVEIKGYGHFTMEDMATDEFPKLLNEIISTE